LLIISKIPTNLFSDLYTAKFLIPQQNHSLTHLKNKFRNKFKKCVIKLKLR